MDTAVVTGGTRGIGAAVSEALLDSGWRVVALYCKNDLKATEFEESQKGKPLTVCRCDISSSEEIERVFGEIGRVGLLVNNAGVSEISLLTDLSGQRISELISVDLTGAILCSKAVIPSMVREKKGSIINVSSMWGEAGASCEAVYSAAKAGLIGFTKALAKELAPSGIRVNCVSPGFIQTEMNASLGSEAIADIIEEIPLGKAGTPKDVAAAVEFLASEKAGYITGEVLRVNGGLVI